MISIDRVGRDASVYGFGSPTAVPRYRGCVVCCNRNEGAAGLAAVLLEAVTYLVRRRAVITFYRWDSGIFTSQ
jgi:hypothetical protein